MESGHNIVHATTVFAFPLFVPEYFYFCDHGLDF